MRDRLLDTVSGNCILTNANVFSPDGKWIVYDVRSTAMGDVFDGDCIERINVDTGEVQVLYHARHGAHVGVATYHPIEDAVIFIQGPEHPTPDWSYDIHHRQGVIVYVDHPEIAHPLEARDLIFPFTAGALRGGTHVHMFSADGQCVSFTYDDAVLPANGCRSTRNVGVSVKSRNVIVPKNHPRNRDGEWFSVLVTKTVNDPAPGSDEISRAFEDSWIGTHGYRRADGAWQQRALAFLGDVQTADGQVITELFVVDLPEDLTRSGVEPLAGTRRTLPAPPAGVMQRRLTFTADRKYPGIHGPRHWPRSSPDGQTIAFLMRDDTGIVQLWTIPTIGGPPIQRTHDRWAIASAFTWNPAGTSIAHIADGSVFTVCPSTSKAQRLTPRVEKSEPLLPLACVFDPTGGRIAYLQRVESSTGVGNRIRICELGPAGRFDVTRPID